MSNEEIQIIAFEEPALEEYVRISQDLNIPNHNIGFQSITSHFAKLLTENYATYFVDYGGQLETLQGLFVTYQTPLSSSRVMEHVYIHSDIGNSVASEPQIFQSKEDLNRDILSIDYLDPNSNEIVSRFIGPKGRLIHVFYEQYEKTKDQSSSISIRNDYNQNFHNSFHSTLYTRPQGVLHIDEYKKALKNSLNNRSYEAQDGKYVIAQDIRDGDVSSTQPNPREWNNDQVMYVGRFHAVNYISTNPDLVMDKFKFLSSRDGTRKFKPVLSYIPKISNIEVLNVVDNNDAGNSASALYENGRVIAFQAGTEDFYSRNVSMTALENQEFIPLKNDFFAVTLRLSFEGTDQKANMLHVFNMTSLGM